MTKHKNASPMVKRRRMTPKTQRPIDDTNADELVQRRHRRNVSAIVAKVLIVPLLLFFLIYRFKQHSRLDGGTSDATDKVTLYVADLDTIRELDHPLNLPTDVRSRKASKPFTQGLLVLDYSRNHTSLNNESSAILLESSGLYDASFLRLFDVNTGNILSSLPLPGSYFAEGICEIKSYVFMLTWREQRLLVFRLRDGVSVDELHKQRSNLQTTTGQFFNVIDFLSINDELPLITYITQFRIAYEGWGLSSDGDNTLWMTRGADDLIEFEIPWSDIYKIEAKFGRRTMVEPSALQSLQKLTPKQILKITCFNSPLHMVNDLEYDKRTRTLWGNIFNQLLIVELDVNTGKCIGMSNLSNIYNPANSRGDDVMNGIATHRDMGDLRFYITGKRWPKIYELSLIPIPTSNNKSVNPTTSYVAVDSWEDALLAWSQYFDNKQ